VKDRLRIVGFHGLFRILPSGKYRPRLIGDQAEKQRGSEQPEPQNDGRPTSKSSRPQISGRPTGRTFSEANPLAESLPKNALAGHPQAALRPYASSAIPPFGADHQEIPGFPRTGMPPVRGRPRARQPVMSINISGRTTLRRRSSAPRRQACPAVAPAKGATPCAPHSNDAPRFPERRPSLSRPH